MTDLPAEITLEAEEEALRLWQGAQRAREGAAKSVAALSETLDLGLRAAEILAVRALQPLRDRFPATIGLLLQEPAPEVDVHRDAVRVPHVLQFTDVLDLLSEGSLGCVGPGLHRGWEDRVFSCRRSRTTAQEALEITLQAEERDRLLVLAAYRNRIFRSPPPIRILPSQILPAFEDLKRLVERLS